MGQPFGRCKRLLKQTLSQSPPAFVKEGFFLPFNRLFFGFLRMGPCFAQHRTARRGNLRSHHSVGVCCIGRDSQLNHAVKIVRIHELLFGDRRVHRLAEKDTVSQGIHEIDPVPSDPACALLDHIKRFGVRECVCNPIDCPHGFVGIWGSLFCSLLQRSCLLPR